MAKKQRHSQKLKQQKSQEKKVAASSPSSGLKVAQNLATDDATAMRLSPSASGKAADDLHAKQDGKVVGLVNLGCTCFYNAAVQVPIFVGTRFVTNFP
jgi:ubiquitin C-terminal hydrolase